MYMGAHVVGSIGKSEDMVWGVSSLLTTCGLLGIELGQSRLGALSPAPKCVLVKYLVAVSR